MCAWAVLMDRPFLFLGGGAEDRGRLSQQAMIRVRRQLFNGDLFRAILMRWVCRVGEGRGRRAERV